MEQIYELPYVWVFLFFWCLALMRSNTIYWIGRGITAGTARSRWAAMLDSPMYLTAQGWSERWGVLAVPMSFFTVGLQSFIQLSAGVTRMPLHHYVPATMVGGVGWAAVYTTIGMAVIKAWFASPAGRVVSVILVVAFIASVILQRRRTERAAQARAQALNAAKGQQQG